MAMIRRRVSSFTIGLPRRARDTVGWDTPARCAISSEVAFPRMFMRPAADGWPHHATDHGPRAVQRNNRPYGVESREIRHEVACGSAGRACDMSTTTAQR